MQIKMKGENTGMGMIECINHKNNKERRRELLSELNNNIKALDDMHTRLRKNGASSDILVMLSRAREQISIERRKMVAEMRKRGHE